MPNPPRKIAFISAATEHGTLIVNRFDQHLLGQSNGYGVGFQLLETASYDGGEIDLALKLLDLRRQHHGDGVVAVDCGANVGVHTIEWARHMTGWGVVLAIEAQERIYYALAGNIAINNCFNARAIQRKPAGRHENAEAELPCLRELRKPRTEKARANRIYWPAHRLFRMQYDRRADDKSRCAELSAP
jgi:hypothetical protein